MKKTLSVSVEAVEREKYLLLHEIETLRSVSAQVEALLGVWVDPLWGLRADINGRVHVLGPSSMASADLSYRATVHAARGAQSGRAGGHPRQTGETGGLRAQCIG